MEKDGPPRTQTELELARCGEALVRAGRLEPNSVWLTLPTTWTKEHADELRIAGNESYRLGALHDAIGFYENAIGVATAIQEDNLLPTYLSNLSAAYYESGEYEKALDVIDRAFECMQVQADLAGVENIPTPLDIKLRIRECRCLLHISEFDQLLDAVQEVGQNIYDEHIEFGVVEDAALHSLDQLAAWDSERARKLVPRLPRYRPSMRKRSRLLRRSMVGRDTATSALAAYPSGDKEQDGTVLDSRILLSNKPRVSFFYGGCGDPRHVLASIVDVYKQAPDQGAGIEVKMALVDNNPTVIARNVLIFFIMDDLASKDLTEDLSNTSQEVTEILTILHYTYVGAIMPNWVHERLLGYLRVISAKLCSGLGVPAWMSISLDAIDQIIPVFKFWVRGATEAVSIQDWMDMQRPLDRPNDLISSPNVPTELKQRLRDSRESARADIKDAIFNFSDAQLNTILRARCADAKSMSLEKKKDLAFQLFATDEALDTLNRKRYVPDGLLMEYSTFYQGSLKMLYGPEKLTHKEPKLAAHLKALWSAWGAAQKIDTTSPTADTKNRTLPLLHVREYVRTHWKINVTLVDEMWSNESRNASAYEVSFDPFAASQQLARCLNGKDICAKPLRAYDFTASFFLMAARSFKEYSSNFFLEFMVDESHQVLETINKTPEDTNFDFFDRIYFLSPPDATGGLLSQAIDSMAILKPSTQAFLASKIVNSSTHFSSLEELFSEYFGLPNAFETQRYLGLGVCGKVAGDFYLADYIRLKPADPANVTTISLAGNRWNSGSAVQRIQLIEWLHQVFLKIVIPVRRTSQRDTRPQQPLNLHSFFRLLLYLQSVDFPSHWLSSVVDDIIQNRVLTRARPPISSTPSVATTEKPLKAICMTPFSLEMEVALATWFPLVTFGITAVEFPDAANVQAYSIKLGPASTTMTPYEEGLPLLALWFSTNANKKINLDLARDIVGNHNAVQSVRLVSCFEWDFDTRTARFMCNVSSMELMLIQNFTVRLIRVDTYETVSAVASVKQCGAYSTLSDWQEPV